MSKYNREEIMALYNEEISKTEVARLFAAKKGIPYNDNVRSNVSKIIRKALNKQENKYYVQNAEDLEEREEVLETAETLYPEEEFIMPSAWSPELNRFLSIEEYCEAYNLNYDSLEKYNLVAHNRGHMVYNVRFKPTLREVTGITEEYIEEVVKKHVKPVSLPAGSIIPNNEWFDRLVYSDVHINMNPNGFDGSPLYEGKWDEEEVLKRLSIMINHVVRHRKSNYLVISELGDFQDGLGGETTRGGHKLPQNTGDKEAFDLGVLFKMQLIDLLAPYFDHIFCNNVVNDNHSGVFGYFVNAAVKGLVESKYPEKVVYRIQTKFIDHYTIGKHTFLETHGKDSHSLKWGFKPFLEPKQAEKIDQYCKEHKLYNGGNYIEFSKGDSHIGLFDDTTSNDFQYYNYPAFSPPSDWVKTSFKNSKSGFRFFNIDKNSQLKIHIPYYFE